MTIWKIISSRVMEAIYTAGDWWQPHTPLLRRIFAVCAVIIAGCMAALLFCGCNSSLVSVPREYHFHAPVYYPQVTVEKQIKSGGLAR